MKPFSETIPSYNHKRKSEHVHPGRISPLGSNEKESSVRREYSDDVIGTLPSRSQQFNCVLWSTFWQTIVKYTLNSLYSKADENAVCEVCHSSYRLRYYSSTRHGKDVLLSFTKPVFHVVAVGKTSSSNGVMLVLNRAANRVQLLEPSPGEHVCRLFFPFLDRNIILYFILRSLKC